MIDKLEEVEKRYDEVNSLCAKVMSLPIWTGTRR